MAQRPSSRLSIHYLYVGCSRRFGSVLVVLLFAHGVVALAVNFGSVEFALYGQGCAVDGNCRAKVRAGKIVALGNEGRECSGCVFVLGDFFGIVMVSTTCGLRVLRDNLNTILAQGNTVLLS